MPDNAHEVWITGVGLVSSLGEGPQAHWEGLESGRIVVDAERFAPYIVHPNPALEFDRQIPKKGDQRQMEAWQRIGVYAAGLALDDAGVKGDGEILSRTDLIVAAGGGERDFDVDRTLMTSLPGANRPQVALNERLMSDLRPTLFLAQLSNLLAGNISIVHGVTGSSRTFMGEEQAGVDALRIALARIQAGQSRIALVGAASNSERVDMLLLYEFAKMTLKDRFAPVWQRQSSPGFALGSAGVFLVLESRQHAEGRKASPIARLSSVASAWSARKPGDVAASLQRLYEPLTPRLRPREHAIVAGATGAEPATGEERRFLEGHPDVPARATATFVGHGMEAQFPMNVAIASLALKQGRLFRSHDESGAERGACDSLRQAVVTSVGHWRGEGMALVEAVD
jgi:3-oxoacyl-[acyl-carrier-protein] synthase II